MLFVTPVKGAKVTRAAREVGMASRETFILYGSKAQTGQGWERRSHVPPATPESASWDQRNRHRQEVRKLHRVTGRQIKAKAMTAVRKLK